MQPLPCTHHLTPLPTLRSKGFALEKSVAEFWVRTIDAEAAMQKGIDSILDRVAHLQLLIPRVDDHERRIQKIEGTLKAHARLLETHGQILEEYGERIHMREEIADQHAVSIMDLQGTTQKHSENFLQVQAQFEERQLSRTYFSCSSFGHMYCLLPYILSAVCILFYHMIM